ncbi:MAG TPA: TIGR01906 family membrane protein [Clostridia bacterium]|nr:TIGR01906 family membrane protein [Clostridia bacterium]
MGHFKAIWIIRVVGVLAVSLLIIGMFLTVIDWTAFDLNFYRREYKKLNIPQSTGMGQGDLLKATEGLLDYVRGRRGDLMISAPVHGQERQVFNQREIDHMVDVKDLFASGFRLRWASLGTFACLIALIIYFRGRKAARDLAISYLIVLSILIILGLILLIFILIDFTTVWDQFHYTFFTNDLWLLDPATDILIQMVPEQFFFDMVVRILGTFGSILVIIAIGAVMALSKTGRTKVGMK